MSLISSCLVRSFKQWKNTFRQIGKQHRLHQSECHKKNCSNLANQVPGRGVIVVIFGRNPSISSKSFLFPTRLIFRQNVRFYPKKKPLPFERNMIVEKQKEDILLYENFSRRFYAIVHVCGISQFFMWLFIASTLYSTSYEYEEDDETKKKQGYFASVGSAAKQVMTDKYKNSRTLWLIFCGTMFWLMTLFYPARNVRQMWLSDSGKFVKVSTFALFEKEPLTIPLTAISCIESRTHSSSHLPLRIRGQKLFYLIDKTSGKFYHEKVFDFTVGLQRQMKM